MSDILSDILYIISIEFFIFIILVFSLVIIKILAELNRKKHLVSGKNLTPYANNFLNSEQILWYHINKIRLVASNLPL